MTNLLYDVTTGDRKYRYTMDEQGVVRTYRYDEPWHARDQSAIGDKFLLTLVQDLANTRERVPTPVKIAKYFNADNNQLENEFSDESEGDTWERTLTGLIYMLRNNQYKVVGYETRNVAYHDQDDEIFGWDIHRSLPDWVSEVDFDGRPRWDVRPVYALRSKVTT